MNCPRCEYHGPFEQTRCPRCFSTFETAALEELGHLQYLRDWLGTWRTTGLMTPEVVNPALDATTARIGEVERTLGLRPAGALAPAAPRPTPAPAVAATPPAVTPPTLIRHLPIAALAPTAAPERPADPAPITPDVPLP